MHREACDPVSLQEGSLPSDGSGIDPHATLLAVQPVTRTGQRRAGNVEVVAVVPLFVRGRV